MKIEQSRALVFGAGSIGERHINNLLHLGCKDIVVYRQRNLPLRNVDSSKIRVITDLDEIPALSPDVAFVTSPTAQHLLQTTYCLKQGIPVLVEKPLSHTLAGLSELKDLILEKNTLLQVGYMMRFHPLIQKVKKATEDKTWGNLIGFRSYWGEYLPQWHPWEDYRTSYAARKELGGGASLTLSHDIDLANWIAGTPVSLYHTVFNTRSLLEVNVESGADINLKYENGITGHVHLNFFQKVAKREYQFEYDDASVTIDFFKAELTVRTVDHTETISVKDFDRNDLFIEQTKAFYALIGSADQTAHALNQVEESELIITICQHGK